MGEDIGDEPKDARVYNLNPLKDRNFQFVFDTTSRIQSVRVKFLRFTRFVGTKARIILEDDPSDNRYAIYDLMDRTFVGPGSVQTGGGDRISLNHVHVTQVKLAVEFVPDGKAKPKRRTVAIAHPNSCDLGDDEYDAEVRKMLVASGLEPIERHSAGSLRSLGLEVKALRCRRRP